MRNIILLAIILLLSKSVEAQKLYVWCPKDQLPTPRNGFLENDTIDLVIFDGRILTDKSKVECTPEKTIQELDSFIQKTYPSARINLLEPSYYYKDPVKNRVTVKIGISAYHAAFGADVEVGIGSVGGNFSYAVFPKAKWNAVTAYALKVYDYRNNGEIKKTKEILKNASRPNTGGYITAKNILNTTYIEANQELLFFIDETLMK